VTLVAWTGLGFLAIGSGFLQNRGTDRPARGIISLIDPSAGSSTMEARQKRGVPGPLGTLLTFGTTRDLSDGQLLERFATVGGEAAEHAFAALVERHGPMVLHVCRSVLSDPHDAEDAFQATFLVLVRKGRGLWVEDSLGPWLHQVAVRTALRARSSAARRRRHEQAAMVVAAATTTSPPRMPDSDLERLLHEEIDCLPERFRIPVILCELEGCTHDQAARHLGWPVGTVKSRLNRARERLRGRLSRRGLAPEAGLAIAPSLGGADELLPTGLVDVTARAAARFAASKTILDGTIATLVLGVLRTMSMNQMWKLGSALLVAGATVSLTSASLLGGNGQPGGEAIAQAPPTAEAPGNLEIPVTPVRRATFRESIHKPGALEAARNQDLRSQVEGETAILVIVPEGTRVKKGDLVCELDAAALRDQLTNQRIANMTAQANYQNARLTREVAEIAVKEYEEGIYLQQKAVLQAQIKLAESALTGTNDRLEKTEQARKSLDAFLRTRKAPETAADIMADLDLNDRLINLRLKKSQDRDALEQAQSRLNVLENYTRGKTIMELRSEIEKARSDELARKATFELEHAKEARLERLIAHCKIQAPGDGVVVYAHEAGPIMKERATVREGQKIVSIVNFGDPMQVHVRLLQSEVAQVKPGQKVALRVGAFPNEPYTGVVAEVDPLPDQLDGNDHGTYKTLIKLDRGDTSLRPGMTVVAEIVVSEHENALAVPRACMIRGAGEKSGVAVRKPDGNFEWRDVVTGLEIAGELVEIKRGLEFGEQVATDVERLIREGFNRGKPATKK
jgi:RND family efflux transporter MFP subunit